VVVDNAVIMAAGLSSRFEPLCYEKPKGLVEVKGEILIERQIRQLKEVGINEIYVVVGYKMNDFKYLEDKYEVNIVHNSEDLCRNNNSSIYAVRKFLKNTYICNQDNYFTENIFMKNVINPYCSVVYNEKETDKDGLSVYCDDSGLIRRVTYKKEDSYVIKGPALWDEKFSKKFVEILENEYFEPSTYDATWEMMYMAHIDELDLYSRRYDDDVVYEFNTVEELARFDDKYAMYLADVYM